MKKLMLFLIPITLFWGLVKLLRNSEATLPRFTRKEQEILDLIVLGYDDNEIAETLRTGERVLQRQKRNILRKTHLLDMSSAIKYALEKQIVSIDYA